MNQHDRNCELSVIVWAASVPPRCTCQPQTRVTDLPQPEKVDTAPKGEPMKWEEEWEAFIRNFRPHVKVEIDGLNYPEIHKQLQEESRHLLIQKSTAFIRSLLTKTIEEHNARILNQFQLQGKPDTPFIAYDERVCLLPAMTIATKETLGRLKQLSHE